MATELDRIQRAIAQLCELLAYTDNQGLRPYRPGAEEILKQLLEEDEYEDATDLPTNDK